MSKLPGTKAFLLRRNHSNTWALEARGKVRGISFSNFSARRKADCDVEEGVFLTLAQLREHEDKIKKQYFLAGFGRGFEVSELIESGKQEDFNQYEDFEVYEKLNAMKEKNG